MKTLKNNYEYLCLLILIGLGIWIRCASYIMPGDDGYMTLKLADNFAKDFGFYYNQGEPIFGTTPLYTVLLGLLCKALGLTALSSAFYFGLIFSVCNFIVIYLLAFKLTNSKALGIFATFLLVTSYQDVEATVFCMETPLFLFTILTSFYLSMKDDNRSRYLTGICCGLSFLTRPEGSFVLIAIVICRLYRERRIPFQEGIAFTILVLPWIIFSYLKFGSFIPCSVKAKSLAYIRNPLGALSVLILYCQLFLTKTYIRDYGLVRDIFVQILVIILWHLVFVKGYIARIKIQKELVPMALFFLIFVGSYTIANPAVFPWYVVSLELIYIFGLVVGLKHFFSLNSNFGKAWGNSIIIYLVCFSCLQYNFANEKFAPFSMVWAEHPDIYGFPKKTLSYDNRENLYIQIAKDLKSEITSETIVLAPEFGAFGYYSDAKIVSSIGHINPEVLKYLPNKRNEIVGEKINHAISLEMVKGVLPDYIISLEIFFRNSLKNNEWFNSNYQIQKIYPSNVFYSEGLYVYKKI